MIDLKDMAAGKFVKTSINTILHSVAMVYSVSASHPEDRTVSHVYARWFRRQSIGAKFDLTSVEFLNAIPAEDLEVQYSIIDDVEDLRAISNLDRLPKIQFDGSNCEVSVMLTRSWVRCRIQKTSMDGRCLVVRTLENSDICLEDTELAVMSHQVHVPAGQVSMPFIDTEIDLDGSLEPALVHDDSVPEFLVVPPEILTCVICDAYYFPGFSCCGHLIKTSDGTFAKLRSFGFGPPRQFVL